MFKHPIQYYSRNCNKIISKGFFCTKCKKHFRICVCDYKYCFKCEKYNCVCDHYDPCLHCGRYECICIDFLFHKY